MTLHASRGGPPLNSVISSVVKRSLSNCYKSHCFHRLSGAWPTPQKNEKGTLFVLQAMSIL